MTRAGHYEYLSDSGSYRIERLTLYQLMVLADEVEETGEDRQKWESVLERWALGYRPPAPVRKH